MKQMHSGMSTKKSLAEMDEFTVVCQAPPVETTSLLQSSNPSKRLASNLDVPRLPNYTAQSDDLDSALGLVMAAPSFDLNR